MDIVSNIWSHKHRIFFHVRVPFRLIFHPCENSISRYINCTPTCVSTALCPSYFFSFFFFSKPFPGGGGPVYRDRRFVFDVDRKWNARRTLAVIAFRAFPATSSGLSSPGYREIDRRTEIDRDRSNLSDEKCILCSSPRAHPLRARVVYKVVSLSLSTLVSDD